MKSSTNSDYLIKLHAEDNVWILTRSLKKGEFYEVEGERYVLLEALGLGHKIASRGIRKGEKVLKYGTSIGSATQGIKRGEHVHLHNMKSDYLPTYILEEGRGYES